jgi:BASS family bile acid:Na+ symporter
VTPTAVAAPGVVSLLKGNVRFVISCVLLTNVFMAFAWPFFFQYIGYGNITVLPVLLSTLKVIIVPLLAAQFVRLVFPKVKTLLVSKFKFLTFYVWLGAIFLPISRASDFVIRQSDV